MSTSRDDMSECLLQMSMHGQSRSRPEREKTSRSSRHPHMESTEHYVMVAAIDFGTTFSGYAFSFKTNPEAIAMNKNWGAVTGFESYKTPTCVLTGPSGDFVAFGYEAEAKYGQIVEDTPKHQYHMFRHFKMLLHNEKNVSRQSTIVSENGKKCSAMDIFVMAIRYLKQHLIELVSKQVNSEVDEKMIRWVLTVPAIWTDSAKQFMREAAFQAGCITSKDSSQLVIALEPEAASLFCRKIEIGEYIMKGDLQELPFKAQTQYLVIDAGGGTVDITAHEVLVTGQVRELHIANGGPWGGINVDKQFIITMKEIFGSGFIDKFMKKTPTQWLNLMSSFEKAKKHINPFDTSTRITVQLSWAIGKQFQDYSGKEIPEVINQFQSNGISFQNGSLVFTHEASIQLFEPVMDNIQAHVKRLFQSTELQKISYVVLVGGFGESRILQNKLGEVIPEHVSTIVPPEAQLAVIKGAVHFGHNRKAIKSRIAKKTYGIDVMHHFLKEKHEPKRKRVLAGGREWCDDIFECFVLKGDSVDVGHKVKRRKKPVYEGQQWMDVDIFCSDNPNVAEVEYVDAPHFQRLGGIRVNMPNAVNTEDELNREVEINFLFGGTEIEVRAKDVTSGSTAKTVIDFITD